MIHIFYPYQDASVYSGIPTRNTGLDEILEIGKTDDGTQKVRSLIQFDVASISQSLVNYNIPANATYSLKLYIARAENLKNKQNIQIGSLKTAWDEGTGRIIQDVRQDTDGVTWQYFNQYTTSSVYTDHFPEMYFNQTYFSTDNSSSIVPRTSIPLSIPVSDLQFDITPYINTILATPDYGMVIKFDDASENDLNNLGNVKVFSKDTNTIYRPHLVVKYDSQTYVTASMMPYPTTDATIIPSTLKPVYRVGETARVELVVRPRVPLKTFATQFTQYLGQRMVPKTSYFSIVDALTNTIVIPFSEASKISCDGTVSYFTFSVENMYPLRYYKVVIKVQNNTDMQIFDDGFIFKVDI